MSLSACALGLASAMFAGRCLELLAARHYEQPAQRIPAQLCLAGLVSVLLVRRRPERVNVIALRVLMVITAGGALLGVWEIPLIQVAVCCLPCDTCSSIL